MWYLKYGICTGGLYGDKNTCKPYPFPPCGHHGAESEYPPCEEYQPTPKCSNQCIDEYPYSLQEDYKFGDQAYSIPISERNTMTEIMEKGSVSASFAVYEDFPLYKSGIYQHLKGGYLGGHAVKIIGWGVENGVKYWLVANSWNESWGEKGFFRFIRGKNDCGFEQNICAATPKL